MGLNLLEKTELWVNEITLANANLSDMADAVAEQLGLDKGKVMVVDVRPRHITFDVLERNVPQAGIMGKERAILSALAALPGVCLTDKSYGSAARASRRGNVRSSGSAPGPGGKLG